MHFTVSTFKALGSKTRINILRSLRSRRMTLSEISTLMEMHPSTVQQHIEILRNVGLVSRKDDGYKWKYYFLTKDGEGVFAARDMSLVLPGIVLFAAGAWNILSSNFFAQKIAEKGTIMRESAIPEAGEFAATPLVTEIVSKTGANMGGILLVVTGILLLVFYLYLHRKK
ncbi:MAG: winged helix-turn-helix transcriptional regulator [Candidatus Aenigmarchaeota archaeon]|nr:winged helix-turn-helix transcriptional regulator [Candidatus Aenigmarchaeota archaeon]MCK5333573.1 winged helix-turn-helix transcriptional regulator [Candidatus Aenigmarchaeota archaeon]